MITVIDYGRGNLFSIGQALRHLGHDFAVTDDADQIAAAQCVILPGVGAFGDAMATLQAKNLVEPIRQVAERGARLIGICLGMQLLAASSDEFGQHEGLALIPGKVTRIPDGPSRIPNVGWRQPLVGGDPIFAPMAGGMVYFVHSYYLDAENPADVAASIMVNGVPVTAAVRRGNIMGCQFHPEKSGKVGLDLLARMLHGAC
jgi:glutamine amidotransferase